MKIEPIYPAIGKAIAERRVDLGLTQGQLAERLEISRPSLANIEAGRQRMLVHQVYEIAAALHVLPSELVPRQRVSARDFIHLTARERPLPQSR